MLFLLTATSDIISILQQYKLKKIIPLLLVRYHCGIAAVTPVRHERDKSAFEESELVCELQSTKYMRHTRLNSLGIPI